MTKDQRATRSRVPPVFESLAYLYTPAEPSHRAVVVEAGERWERPPQPDPSIEVVLWGRHARNVRPSLSGVAFAVRREAALVRVQVRPPRGLHLAELHRLVPVSRPGRLRRPIRTVLLGGALAELVRGDRPTRVIDAVALAAGASSISRGLRPSGDGSALARLDLDASTQVELRVAKVGHTKDPARGRAALLALAAADVALVPKPLAGGITAGAAWATESVVAGRHVDALTPALLDQIVRFLAALPAGPADRRAVDDQLAEVAAVFPEHAAAFERTAAAAARWGASLPAVLVHGDMWLNNVFVTDGQLSGVFDWDTWHPAGLPGTDLLNLLAAEARTRQRRDIGELLADDYWRSAGVVDPLRAYMRARDMPVPDATTLAAIAIGWWASRIAGSLHRAHRAIDDPAWVSRNIDVALERLDRLERELG
jgi:aminoglycoside phosphotransferase (APT) family kinase protein